MKKITLLLSLVLLSSLVFCQQKPASTLAAAFDRILSTEFKAGAPGASVLISRNGQVIYKKAFGSANMELGIPMQVDNVFRIGSITKQFTAIAILQLMEKGKLDLRDTITKFLPDLPAQARGITIEHLLTHTSGIRNFTSIADTVQRSKVDFTPRQMVDYFKNEPLRFAPGTRWEYSNSGYFLLGYLIEKITGETYAEYLEKNFFRPLGMTSSLYANDIQIINKRASGYSKNEKGFENAAYISMTQPYAAGAIQSTVGDLFKWHQAVSSYKLVKKETLDKAWSRYKLADGTATNYGYGWRMGYVQGRPSIWHAGLINGFITMSLYLPKEDVYVTILCNCENYSPENIAAQLAGIAIGQPYEHKAVALEPSILKAYAGVYENERGQQRVISFTDNMVYSRLNRAPKTLIKAYRKDKFFLDTDLMQTIEFTRDGNGAVTKLITKSLTSVDVWTKTDKPIPSEDGIKLNENIIEAYVGEYEVTPEFHFTVTREKDRIFVEPSGQPKFEIFAESETKFFLKVNDAQLEFVKDNSGKVSKVILIQGSRKTDAKRIN